MSTEDSLRAWAARCAASPFISPAERAAWLVIAERGAEWPVARHPDGRPRRGGPLMMQKLCFRNAALTAFGCTAFDPAGAHYAEGFAQGTAGLWFHHAWVVSSAGEVIERTWETPGDRYVGVILTRREFTHGWGGCQLSTWPIGISLAPVSAEGETHDAHGS